MKNFFNGILVFFKGIFGWKDGCGPSSTDVVFVGLFALVAFVVIRITLYGDVFPYFESLLQWTIGGGAGIKAAKGAAVTVQKQIDQKYSSNNEGGE